jgi:hypothetical protein
MNDQTPNQLRAMRLRLFASLVALAAGAGAVIVAILLLHNILT